MGSRALALTGCTVHRSECATIAACKFLGRVFRAQLRQKWLIMMMKCHLLAFLLLPVVQVARGRPQTADRLFQPVRVEEVPKEERDSVHAEFEFCNTSLRRLLPECQNEAQPYGQIWGEITVEVSSPLLIVNEPGDRKKKRKEKNKKKKQQV